MSTSDCTDVCVIGGGFSGVMLCAQLARRGYAGRVTLLERPGVRIGGLAYAPPSETLLLNVPARGMGAWGPAGVGVGGAGGAGAEETGDFHAWLTRSGQRVESGAFVARAWFGAYLRDLLSEAQRRLGARLNVMAAEAADVAASADGWRVLLSGGGALSAGQVVLATGHQPPEPPPEFLDGLASDGAPAWWRPDPWAEAAHAPARAGERILIVGTGLTMVDLCLSMARGGASARIIAISRRGLLPRVQALAPAAPAAGSVTGPLSTVTPGAPLRAVVRAVVAEGRRLSRQGADWRPAIDRLRPITQRVWAGFSDADRRRFLRHVRALWDAHRHRVPPEAAGQIEELRRRGVLQVVAARILGARGSGPGGPVRIEWRRRSDQQREWSEFDRVVNASGSRSTVGSAPLLRAMADRGLIAPDELGLGLQTDEAGRAVGSGGQARDGLWALGPLRRGTLWESTAVAELRLQAEALAARLGETLTSQGGARPD